MTKIKVAYIYGGFADFTKMDDGVLLPDGRVFASDAEGYGVYNAIATSDPELYLVNLDVEYTAELPASHAMLLA
nr:hypothetical protein [Heyndrickxia coagulans]